MMPDRTSSAWECNPAVFATHRYTSMRICKDDLPHGLDVLCELETEDCVERYARLSKDWYSRQCVVPKEDLVAKTRSQLESKANETKGLLRTMIQDQVPELAVPKASELYRIMEAELAKLMEQVARWDALMAELIAIPQLFIAA